MDQEGNRIDDRNVNVLHVMANESFAEFADTLQKEIEQETGVRFGVLDISLFAGMVYTETRQEIRQVTPELAVAAVKTLEQKGYLDAHKKITPALREAIQQNRVEIAEELMPVLPKITEFSQKEESAPLGADGTGGRCLYRHGDGRKDRLLRGRRGLNGSSGAEGVYQQNR